MFFWTTLYSSEVPCLKVTGTITKFLFKGNFPIPRNGAWPKTNAEKRKRRRGEWASERRMISAEIDMAEWSGGKNSGAATNIRVGKPDLRGEPISGMSTVVALFGSRDG